MEPVFNQALKAGHVGFITDTYIECTLKSINILAQDNPGVCSTLVYETKGASSECRQHWPTHGGRDLQSYTV